MYNNKKIISFMLLMSIVFSSNFLVWVTNANYDMFVNVTHLNLRASGTTQSKILQVLDKWTQLSILEETQWVWRKVETSQWVTWYVHSKFLTDIEPYYEKTQWVNYEVSVDSAFVRWNNFKSIKAVLRLGDQLEVLDERIVNWFWVKVRISQSNYKDAYVWVEWYISKKIIQPNASMENVSVANSDDTMNNSMEEEAPAVEASTEETSDSANDTTNSEESITKWEETVTDGETTSTEEDFDESILDWLFN